MVSLIPLLGAIRGKSLHRWLPGYARHLVRRARATEVEGPRHLLFAFCDHYEPLWGGADAAHGDERVRAWETDYPALARRFTDADGLHPRHTFFFPGEQYGPGYLERLARLAHAGLGEVELHLHHDGDDAVKLRRDIGRYLADYARHGHLARDADGRIRYAFIHGNWSLANARRDGRWCGVDGELPLLFDTGCYADYTFPAAPDECQPGIVNQIYWPTGDLERRRAYETGLRACVGEPRRDRILMIQGPLALTRRPGRLVPRIESAAVTAADPATPPRIASWVAQGICVAGRPEWVFVKVHAHGAPEAQARSLLGGDGERLHHELTERYNDGERFVLHYVTAREMFNIAIAAVEGASGDPAQYRDHQLAPPPAMRVAAAQRKRAL
jgi:hypothetical protein